jgi:signal transduction histidine kinase
MRQIEKRAAQEAPLADALSAELLATIGHELRGPLTTIQGYAETLLRYESQLALAERQEFLRAISLASAQIGTLVNRFLELAQLETHTHAFFSAPVQMQALVQEAITAAQARGSHRLLLLPATCSEPRATTEAPRDERGGDALTITGDRRLLRTMLDVLLENALAYSAPESLVEVVLVPHTFSTSAEWSPLAVADQPLALILPAAFQDQEPVLEVCVRDHGRGIAPEELSAIFRRFYRVDTRLTREVNGLGLGLTLCQAIVARHQGMLWVESVLGEGSAFHLLLPRGTTTSDHEPGEIARPPKRKEED